MDLIRLFAETAFVRVGERYLSTPRRDQVSEIADELMIDEAMFVDECRRSHPELTDDQLRVVYAIYRDEWSYPIDHTRLNGGTGNMVIRANRHIFNVLFLLAHEFLRVTDDLPRVKFHHLFRWRELTQLIGEDLLACAALAWLHKDRPVYDFRRHGAPGAQPYIDFGGWPTVLHNDNPNLRHIFESQRLCDLHSHLRASTDTFGITWVCLMNHIGGRKPQFVQLAQVQDPSRHAALAETLHRHTAEAAAIRRHLWRHVLSDNGEIGSLKATWNLEAGLTEIDKELAEMRANDYDADYISGSDSGMMSVFAGERMLLYAVLERIIRSSDIRLYELFYRYILIKNSVLSFLVQVNDNKGFNNFKRFQDLKSVFLLPPYDSMLITLPMWEAQRFNYSGAFEARVVPPDTPDGLLGIQRSMTEVLPEDGDGGRLKWSFIFHFIKIHDPGQPEESARDTIVRSKSRTGSAALKKLLESEECRKYISGIDAASAETACRPEAFAQVFRFLKATGYSATFHAGEDFYDIADGLRAIFEAVTFLGLESGDRIGHAIALGIDPQEFYRERHNYIALPAQWMLDNVVWLYFYSRAHNVAVDPQTENFLLTTARNLLVEISFEQACGGAIDLFDYYQSMLLRGDCPEAYRDGAFDSSHSCSLPSDGESWRSFSLQSSPRIKEIRQSNPNAARLYSIYHFDARVKRDGLRMKSAQVPKGYVSMITDLQDSIIREIAIRRLGIECCPSSNLKIGRLHRFDRHPIFRFMPIRGDESRFPLAVTVNTDDLGIFATSLPNEFSLLTLALLKTKDANGTPRYSSREVYDWIRLVIENGHKYRFPRKGEISY